MQKCRLAVLLACLLRVTMTTASVTAVCKRGLSLHAPHVYTAAIFHVEGGHVGVGTSAHPSPGLQQRDVGTVGLQRSGESIFRKAPSAKIISGGRGLGDAQLARAETIPTVCYPCVGRGTLCSGGNRGESTQIKEETIALKRQ